MGLGLAAYLGSAPRAFSEELKQGLQWFGLHSRVRRETESEGVLTMTLVVLE